MRYILDDLGYIEEVTFGGLIECNNKSCTEYTGGIPEGYEDLCDWQCNANIRAYKIIDGNLIYDENKDNELQEQYKQDAKDNSFVLHKEIYGLEKQIEEISATNNSQYQSIIERGKVVAFDNVKACYPKIKIKDIRCYNTDKIKIIINGKNMLPNDAVSQTINGVKFKPNKDKSIKINGTALEKIEYNIAGSSTNTSPFLLMKKNLNYYLNSNDFVIKMYGYDGTDRTEIYSGTGGLINFTDTDKKVTQITLSIDKDEVVDNITIYPQLEFNSSLTDYESYKVKTLDIDFSEFIEDGLFPNDNLFPIDGLFPSGTTLEYILVENGKITSSQTGYNSPNFTLDVSGFDTSNVTDMSNMFDDTGYNSSIFTLDVSGFDTSNVTNMRGMFAGTGANNPNFTLDVSGFDTSKVTDMSYMFNETGYTSNVLNTSITIRNKDLVSNPYRYEDMFSNVAIQTGSQITVNYTSETEALVDQMIATKSEGANVVKGWNVDVPITFTIEGTTYNAYEGMTWEQWVNSEFNTDGYFIAEDYIEEGFIFDKEGLVIKNENWSIIYGDEEIIENYNYKLAFL